MGLSHSKYGAFDSRVSKTACFARSRGSEWGDLEGSAAGGASQELQQAVGAVMKCCSSWNSYGIYGDSYSESLDWLTGKVTGFGSI